MNPDLTIEDIIAQIGEQGAYRFYAYTTEEFPLDPRGWDGMAHLAHHYGDLDRAIAYLEHSIFLSRGIGYAPTQDQGSATSNGYAQATSTSSSSTDSTVSTKGSGYALVAKIALGLGVFCCCGPLLCSRLPTQNTYTAPVVAVQPVETAPPIVSNAPTPEEEGSDWGTAQFTPPGITFGIPDGWSIEQDFHILDDRDSIELTSDSDDKATVRIEVNHANGDQAPLASVQAFNQSFEKAYKTKYKLQSIKESQVNSSPAAIWEFDQQTEKGWKHKRDILFNLPDGRQVAVLFVSPKPLTDDDRAVQEGIAKSIELLKK